MALWAPNIPPAIAFTLAALRIGAAVTGANPMATDVEVRRQFSDAGVAAVLTVPELASRAAALGVPAVLVAGDAASGTPLQAVLAELARPLANEPAPSADVALLPYSSGTTGLPKGVVLSRRNVTAVLDQLRSRLEVTEHDVTLAVAPFFHILGMTAGLLLPLTSGATVVTMARFEPVEFLRLLAEHRVTFLAVPPPLATVLATHPAVAEHDLSALQLLASGGAPLPSQIHQRLAERLPGCAIGQGWGLTETTGAVSIPDRRRGAPIGTVGQPLDATEVRVVDTDSGHPIDPSSDGELEVRGPQVMQGYLGQRTATDAILRRDGWLRTGDLGHLDADGNVVIVDRIKELIKVKGFQVAPTEIEHALRSHPAVADAAVVGRPDDRDGERPIAFVITCADVSPDELSAFLATRVAAYKIPAEITTVESLPRTPSGKLLRRSLA